MKKGNFIWLDPALYPDCQRGKFCIAELKSELFATKPYTVEISALARYMLFINGELVGRGPHTVGGDYFDLGKLESPYYDTHYVEKTGKQEICVLVTSVPTAMDEYDFGACGLYFNAYDTDGRVLLASDEKWDARVVSSRQDVYFTDYTSTEQEYSKAKFIEKSFVLSSIDLDNLVEEKIAPQSFDKIVVKSGKTHRECLFFDKIYSAYPYISVKCQGRCTLRFTSSEEGTAGKITEELVTDRDVLHFSPRMRSIGQIEIEIVNESPCDVAIDDLYIQFIHYPVYEEGDFKCSEALVNDIYDVCMHTLKICRQSIHLDSPTHQEPLACTGDYYIQSLIEYLSLGDPGLAKWDLIRTSNLLKVQDGRLFHTTYSLIYPAWVYEHYMHTGDVSVIDGEALSLLCKRFDSYVSEKNGLLEYAPDYMFVDWVVASCERDEFLDGGKMMGHGKMDGYSLHHPPKALGQSVLCMFYYNALIKMSRLFSLIGNEKSGQECSKKAEKMKESINAHLWDKERCLYVGGLNTPNLVEENNWLPQNTKTVYHLKQANALAVLFGIAPKEHRHNILRYVITDLTKFEMQPYFYHFLLLALHNEGMIDSILPLIRRYESLLERCHKGLSEAWENMECDFSHAWGAAPAYILKLALSGLEIVEPGFKKIKLNPRLLDFDRAEYEITAPQGKIVIRHQRGEAPEIMLPSGITLM